MNLHKINKNIYISLEYGYVCIGINLSKASRFSILFVMSEYLPTVKKKSINFKLYVPCFTDLWFFCCDLFPVLEKEKPERNLISLPKTNDISDCIEFLLHLVKDEQGTGRGWHISLKKIVKKTKVRQELLISTANNWWFFFYQFGFRLSYYCFYPKWDYLHRKAWHEWHAIFLSIIVTASEGLKSFSEVTK